MKKSKPLATLGNSSKRQPAGITPLGQCMIDRDRGTTKLCKRHYAWHDDWRYYTIHADNDGTTDIVTFLDTGTIAPWISTHPNYVNRPRVIRIIVPWIQRSEILVFRKPLIALFFRRRASILEQIEAVSIDLWQGYKNLVTQLMPQAQVVADRFHLMIQINKELDTT